MACIQTLTNGNVWFILTTLSLRIERSVHTLYRLWCSLFTSKTGSCILWEFLDFLGNSFLFYGQYLLCFYHIWVNKEWYFMQLKVHLYLWTCTYIILHAKSITVFYQIIYLIFCCFVYFEYEIYFSLYNFPICHVSSYILFILPWVFVIFCCFVSLSLMYLSACLVMCGVVYPFFWTYLVGFWR